MIGGTRLSTIPSSSLDELPLPVLVARSFELTFELELQKELGSQTREDERKGGGIPSGLSRGSYADTGHADKPFNTLTMEPSKAPLFVLSSLSPHPDT